MLNLRNVDYPWVRAILSRGLGARYSPQVHSHCRRTALSVTRRTGTSFPHSRRSVSMCICNQKFLHRSVLSEKRVSFGLGLTTRISPAEPSETLHSRVSLPETHMQLQLLPFGANEDPQLRPLCVMSVLPLTINNLKRT